MLVVDDTVVYRKIVSDVLDELPDVEVVGVAPHGKIAISRISLLKPDLITLDIEMPEMNGLEVLRHMKKESPNVGAIMLSSLTQAGGEMTVKALELGAFDFIPKPHDGSLADNRKAIKNSLAPMIKAFARNKEISTISRGNASVLTTPVRRAAVKHPPQHTGTRPIMKREKSDIIAIGISTGGPNALAKVMPQLPPDLGVPILIVQHMPAVFTMSLAESLNSKCAIEVREAVNGDHLRPNTAFLAPGGKQMKVAVSADAKRRMIKVTDDPPENRCKPSADYLFRSIAHYYGGRATGVIMTGMGSDGTLGLKLMKRSGAAIIAQDEISCVVYGMPKESVDAGIVDVVAPIENIATDLPKAF